MQQINIFALVWKTGFLRPCMPNGLDKNLEEKLVLSLEDNKKVTVMWKKSALLITERFP